jgi:hypothetical protein
VEFQDLTHVRGDFMIVHTFRKCVEEKLTGDKNDPRDVDLPTFDPGPFQALVKKMLCIRCRLLSEWLWPNYMVPGEDVERMKGDVMADTLPSGQGHHAFTDESNAVDCSGSNGEAIAALCMK